MFRIVLTLFLAAVSRTNASGYKKPCPTGMKNIYNTALTGCYAVVDPTKGLLTYAQAIDECRSIYSQAIPVIMSRRSFLEDIIEFATNEGLPTTGKAGFWTGFTRLIEAPLEANGTLSEENAAIRRNRALFKYHPISFGVSAELWRNEDQPGDQTDERDERCTAQKKPGKPEFMGIDDYPCEGYQLHYAVCIFF